MNKTEQETHFLRKLSSLDHILCVCVCIYILYIYIYIQGVREISAVIVTDDYLCYKEQKSPYNFFHIIYELFTFKTSDEWQH